MKRISKNKILLGLLVLVLFVIGAAVYMHKLQSANDGKCECVPRPERTKETIVADPNYFSESMEGIIFRFSSSGGIAGSGYGRATIYDNQKWIFVESVFGPEAVVPPRHDGKLTDKQMNKLKKLIALDANEISEESALIRIDCRINPDEYNTNYSFQSDGHQLELSGCLLDHYSDRELIVYAGGLVKYMNKGM